MIPQYALRLHKVGELDFPDEHLTTSAQVYGLLRDRFADLDREVFAILCLNAKHVVAAYHEISVGTLTASLVHPREVFKMPVAAEASETYGDEVAETFRKALLGSAAAIILVHNHPSGDPVPSAEDRQITTRLRDAGTLIGIRVLDHVIVARDRYFSFTDSGLL